MFCAESLSQCVDETLTASVGGTFAAAAAAASELSHPHSSKPVGGPSYRIFSFSRAPRTRGICFYDFDEKADLQTHANVLLQVR